MQKETPNPSPIDDRTKWKDFFQGSRRRTHNHGRVQQVIDVANDVLRRRGRPPIK